MNSAPEQFLATSIVDPATGGLLAISPNGTPTPDANSSQYTDPSVDPVASSTGSSSSGSPNVPGLLGILAGLAFVGTAGASLLGSLRRD